MDVDGMTGERPRSRRLLSIIAVAVPVVVFAGGAAFFIRSYVSPPMFAIGKPTKLASLDTASPSVEPAPPPAAMETTGTTSNPPPPPAVNNWSAPVSTITSATTLWPAVPVRTTAGVPERSSSDIAGEAGAPIAGPVPLPPPRPRISLANARGPVPLPRPRPSAPAN